MLFLQEDYGQGMDDPWRLYPAQARRMSDAVPEALREDHDEATRCLAIKAYRASAVMARRIVEGICIDQGYKTGVLQKRLATMRDDGKIDKRLFEWADALRVLGNDGAHAGNMPISRNDAHEVMALVEALLDYLYVFQARFEEFLRNRDASAE
jgi:hypothetical protein